MLLFEMKFTVFISVKPLFTTEEFEKSKTNDKLFCACIICEEPMYRTKRHIKEYYENKRNGLKFCSKKCQKTGRSKSQIVTCKNCQNNFQKKNSYIKKTLNNFCSRSCAATFNNKHKTHGNRRSKLEMYFQEQLTILFPHLEIHYNRKDTINSELDIYIPSLHLAFELNGIFHYEPIFGPHKLDQIQNNDQRKFQACIENKISLCIIDVSKFTYFKEHNAKIYLNILLQIINNKSKNE